MGKSSGYTLVDVVADVFSGVSTAISKVKNVANQALNAVKAGLQFIANAVLLTIHQALAQMVLLGVFGIFKLISTMLNYGDVTLQGNSIIVSVSGNTKLTITILGDVEGIKLTANSLKLTIGSPLDPLHNGFDFESLGLNDGPHWGLGMPIALAWGVVQFLILNQLSNLPAGSIASLGSYGQQTAILLGYTTGGFLSELIYYLLQSQDHKEILKDRFGSLHFGLAISLLSEIYSGETTTKSKYSQTMKNFQKIKYIGTLVKYSNEIYSSASLITVISGIFEIIKLGDDLNDLINSIMSYSNGWGSAQNVDTTLDVLFSVYGAFSGEIVHMTSDINKNTRRPVQLQLIGFAPVLVFIALIHLCVSLFQIIVY